MLFSAVAEYSTPATLIVGRLKPVMIDLSQRSRPALDTYVRSPDIQTVQDSLDEGLDIPERTLNCVVDRLLEELSW